MNNTENVKYNTVEHDMQNCENINYNTVEICIWEDKINDCKYRCRFINPAKMKKSKINKSPWLETFVINIAWDVDS
jgi:hypothetical protein